MFNGKNKLFFFADYEGKRVSQAQTYISTVPTAPMRTGDFSELLPRTIIRAPGTTVPLPNNQVTQIDPTSAKIVNLYPLPNIAGAGQVNNFLYNGPLLNTHRPGRSADRLPHRQLVAFRPLQQRRSELRTIPAFCRPPRSAAVPDIRASRWPPERRSSSATAARSARSKYYEFRAGYSRLIEDIIVADTEFGNIARATRHSQRESSAGRA